MFSSPRVSHGRSSDQTTEPARHQPRHVTRSCVGPADAKNLCESVGGGREEVADRIVPPMYCPGKDRKVRESGTAPRSAFELAEELPGAAASTATGVLFPYGG